MKLPVGRSGLLLFALSACDGGYQAQQEFKPTPARLPPEICAQIGTGLQKLQAKGAVNVDRPGEATIAQAGWLAIEAAQRDQVVTLLAFGAACAAAEPQSEMTVTIRNEYGQTLTQRTVPVTASLEGMELE